LCLAASLSLRPRSLTDRRLAQQAQRKWPQRKRMGSRAAAPRVARVAASAAPPRPVRVLISNDDGPDTPFLAPFVDYVRNVLGWQCFVCIPDDNFSFVSKSITRSPLEVRRQENGVVHVTGSPATCVNLALYQLASDCDLVLSGPNIGHNVGRSAVLSSGTVGAAMEGVIAGRRAMAVSFPFKDGFGKWSPEEIDSAVTAAGETVSTLWDEWDSDQQGVELYNVNVPLGFVAGNGNGEWVREHTFVDTLAGYSGLFGSTTEDRYEWSPTGIRAFDSEQVQEGSDVAAVRDGKVSITPLFANLICPRTSSDTVKA